MTERKPFNPTVLAWHALLWLLLALFLSPAFFVVIAALRTVSGRLRATMRTGRPACRGASSPEALMLSCRR